MGDTLISNSQFFDSMIDLIPLNYYAPNREQKSKYQVNTNKQAPEQSLKANSKRGKKLKEAAVEKPQAENTMSDDADQETTPAPTGAIGEIKDLKAKYQERLQSLSNKRKPDPLKAERNTRKKQKKEQKKLERKDKKAAEKKGDAQSKKSFTPKPVKKSPVVKPAEPEVLDFQFGEVKDKLNPLEPVKRKGGKLEKALKSIEKFESKVERAKEAGIEVAQELLKEKAVSTALLRAKGVKVRDSKKLIKKSLKKVEQKKKKSAKEWSERIGNVAKEMKKKADKRKENIDKKIQKRKEGKLKKKR